MMLRELLILSLFLSMAGCQMGDGEVYVDKEYVGDEVHEFREYYDKDGQLVKREAYIDGKRVENFSP